MKQALRFLSFLAVLFAGIGLFQLKFMVEGKDRELKAIQYQMVEDQRAIRVLRAEWAFLNSPDYLQEMAVRHLGMQPVIPTNVFGEVPTLPWRRSSDEIMTPSLDFVLPSPRETPLRKQQNGSLTDASLVVSVPKDKSGSTLTTEGGGQ